MFKKQKETDFIVDQLAAELYEVEGEITDILTHQLYENYKNYNDEERKEKLNSSECGVHIIKILSEELCDEVFQFECEDVYSNFFFIQLTSLKGDKHYFQMSWYGLPFKFLNLVRVIAQPLIDQKFAKIYAVIDVKEKILWTTIDVERGRIANLKFNASIAFSLIYWLIISLLLIGIFLILIFSLSEGFVQAFWTIYDKLGYAAVGILWFSIWIASPNEKDYQNSIDSEALFKKLGFESVKHLNLEKYSLLEFYRSRGVKEDSMIAHRQARTYLLEMALRDHNRNYKK